MYSIMTQLTTTTLEHRVHKRSNTLNILPCSMTYLYALRSKCAHHNGTLSCQSNMNVQNTRVLNVFSERSEHTDPGLIHPCT